MKTFDQLVAEELARARAKHQPLNSLHEGFAVILEEMDEFKEEVWKKREHREPRKLLAELVQIGAMVQRAAEDCFLLGAQS
jgi:hypothetical protein